MNVVLIGDAVAQLGRIPNQTVDCVVTSPPYFNLRDYGIAGQIGNEKYVDEYIRRLVAVFREVRRTLKDEGVLWLNLGDSFMSAKRDGWIKQKDLIGIPWRVALALQADGWYLRADVIWEKPNCIPDPVKDRPTRSHEYIFLLTKSPRYYYNGEAIREPWVQNPHDIARAAAGHAGYDGKHSSGQAGVKGQPVGDPSKGRNKRTVWRITTKPYKGAYFAVFPEKLPETCIKAGCPDGGVVLDPFAGSGTTLAVAKRLGRRYIGVELNPEYEQLIRDRLDKVTEPLSI